MCCHFYWTSGDFSCIMKAPFQKKKSEPISERRGNNMADKKVVEALVDQWIADHKEEMIEELKL